MDKQMKKNQRLVEYLLAPEEYWQDDAGDAVYGQAKTAADSPLKEQNRQIAYNLKSFVDEMPGGFFVYRADGAEDIVYINNAVLRIFNCETREEFQELTGNSFRGIVHPEDLNEVEESIKAQIASSRYDLDYVEYRIIQKGGEIRWVDDYGHFVHSDSTGDFFYVFIADATDRKRQQQKEREKRIHEKKEHEKQLRILRKEYNQELQVINQEHLRRLEVIEGMSIDYESIFYVNLISNQIKAYRISERFRNKFPQLHYVCEFEGFDSDYIRDWVVPEDQSILSGVTNAEYLRKKLSKERSFHMNYRILKDGNIAYIQLRVVNVGSEENISQIVMGYRNIDAEIIQEMERQQFLTETLREVNRANNAKNLFLSNMSHDIRTPMNAIVGSVALAKKHLGNDARVADCLNMISTASEQLQQLLNDVLEISRIESGKTHVEETECSLLELVYSLREKFLPQAAAKKHAFLLDISNLQHDAVCVDYGKLKQVLSYLIDNAIKYTGENGIVTIRVIEKQEQETKNGRIGYQFIVEDNGIGIGQEFISCIFDPFEREKNTTLSGIHGTGLGLAITKGLVKLLGGTIEVESVVGKGSLFAVTLPLRVQEQKERCEEDDDIIPSFSTPKRILVVDDTEINLEIEIEVLEDAGFLVETACDGSIALEKVKQSVPGYYDLILMDIQMPVMNGYRAASEIRALADPALSAIPIIAVSANAFEEDKKNAIESGMNAHLAKPLDTQALFAMIGKFLRAKEQASS